MALLQKPASLFVTDPAVNCTTTHVETRSGMEEDDHKPHKDHHKDHHDHEEHDQGETHSDIEAHYELSCVNTDKLKTINVRLFEHFPAMHNIALQFIGDRGQTSIQLDHDATTFNLPR